MSLRRFGRKIELDVQTTNARVGAKQYRVSFVTKTINGEPVDRWATVETHDPRIRRAIITRIVKIIGRCRFID